jgi:hypothetical protein
MDDMTSNGRMTNEVYDKQPDAVTKRESFGVINIQDSGWKVEFFFLCNKPTDPIILNCVAYLAILLYL